MVSGFLVLEMPNRMNNSFGQIMQISSDFSHVQIYHFIFLYLYICLLFVFADTWFNGKEYHLLKRVGGIGLNCVCHIYSQQVVPVATGAALVYLLKALWPFTKDLTTTKAKWSFERSMAIYLMQIVEPLCLSNAKV